MMLVLGLVARHFFLHFACEFLREAEYIGIENNKKKEVEMRKQITEEQRELVKRSLDKIIAELAKIRKSELAMRWLLRI